MCAVLTTRTFVDWYCWCCVVQGHYCKMYMCVCVCCAQPRTLCLFRATGGVLSTAATLLVVCISHNRTFLNWDCWRYVVPGHYRRECVLSSTITLCLFRDAGGVLSRASPVVVVFCSHTRTFVNWVCWRCVVANHYCRGCVLCSTQDVF